MEWNWLDVLLGSIILVSVGAAVWQGLIRELFSIASLVIGIILAALEYPWVAGWAGRYFSTPEAAKCAAFIGILVAVLLAGAAASFLLRKILQKAGLGWFDRFLGGIFGLARGVAIASVLLMAMVAFSVKPDIVDRSLIAPYVMMGARAVGTLMPADLSSRFQKGLERFKKALIENDKKAPSN